MTFKQCRNNCGINIEMRQADGKWKAYEENGQIHRCPNWKAMSNFKQTAAKIEGEISLKPQESAFKPNNAMGKIAELETEFSHQMTEMSKRVSRAEQAIQALVKELSYKKASELPKEDIDEQVIEED